MRGRQEDATDLFGAPTDDTRPAKDVATLGHRRRSPHLEAEGALARVALALASLSREWIKRSGGGDHRIRSER
jgi:hypothetical protein